MLAYVRHAYRLSLHAARDIRAPAKRSPHWSKLEHETLILHPGCAGCGGIEKRQVHHVCPFHENPALELEPTNLIVLCMAINRHCHLLAGHGNNFKAANKSIREDAAALLVAYQTENMGLVNVILAKAKANRVMT